MENRDSGVRMNNTRSSSQGSFLDGAVPFFDICQRMVQMFAVKHCLKVGHC